MGLDASAGQTSPEHADSAFAQARASDMSRKQLTPPRPAEGNVDVKIRATATSDKYMLEGKSASCNLCNRGQPFGIVPRCYRGAL